MKFTIYLKGGNVATVETLYHSTVDKDTTKVAIFHNNDNFNGNLDDCIAYFDLAEVQGIALQSL